MVQLCGAGYLQMLLHSYKREIIGLFRTINLKPHYNVELLRNLSDKGRCLPGLHDRRS